MDAKTKKRIYIGLWAMLGVMLGFLAGELVEYFFFTEQFEGFEHRIFFYTLLILAGIVLGLWLGPIAWRKIYVEGARGKKYVVKK
mgnify:CR=1 FL=1